MKITRYLMASSAVALALLMATPALAHSGVSANASVNGDNNPGLHKGQIMRHDNEKKREGDKEDRNTDRQAFLSAIGAANAGIVTSVNGSTFLLSSFGKNGTTTVSTNSSTTYKVNGVATTFGALSEGSRVIVFGTTDSNGITASIVSILNVGRGFFKHFFR